MEFKLKTPSITQRLDDPLFQDHELTVDIKRDDQIHPIISGNKWRKLKLNLKKCQTEKYDGILTFGGAYSNHLRATAHAAYIFGLKSIGIVRGDELSPPTLPGRQAGGQAGPESNSTLTGCAEDGMELIFCKREEYELRNEKYYEEELRRRHGNYLIVPEGGANYLGVLGCMDIQDELTHNYDHIVLAGGTGTTAAGLLYGNQHAKIHLVSVLKGGDFLKDNIVNLLHECGMLPIESAEVMQNLILHTDFHFGGYARYNDELISFMNDFYKATEVPLDQVYTAKMVYAFYDLVKAGTFESESRILLIHTGGLQGTVVLSDRLIY
ncbi:pyridoxal-phosphate dependent enzyme [bacterium AH-315-C20]|nr:pyridoxal-phosphate dependent enzyme [bacterium AH-315-C20]